MSKYEILHAQRLAEEKKIEERRLQASKEVTIAYIKIGRKNKVYFAPLGVYNDR